MYTKDQKIVRELGQQVAEIAALPVQEETISSWKALNALKPVRGMVMLDQISWHEMDVDGELTLQAEVGFCRGIEGQFRRTFDEANRRKGVTGENLLVLLELRLDNIVYSLGFATSRTQARQLVRHGHIEVDGRKTTIPSYQVKVGQQGG